MTERIIAVSGEWALGADSLQWILYRQQSKAPPKGLRDYKGLSFVRTSKDILARCMREKGVGEQSEVLLAGLPDTFDAWLKTNSG